MLGRIERGEIRLHARDTTEPSPFAHEILNAQAVRLPRRRAARGAPDARRLAAPRAARETRATSARSTPPRSSACARKRGRSRATPTSCTTYCSSLVVVRAEHGGRSGARGSMRWSSAGRAATRACGPGGAFWFAAEHLRMIEALYPDGDSHACASACRRISTVARSSATRRCSRRCAGTANTSAR